MEKEGGEISGMGWHSGKGGLIYKALSNWVSVDMVSGMSSEREKMRNIICVERGREGMGREPGVWIR